MRRTIPFICLAVLLSSLCFSTPARAWNNLVYHLAKYGCEGQSSYVKNGCYAYLDRRILRCNSPSDSLSACKKQCDDWFDGGGANSKKCYGGCTFLNNKE